MTKKYTHLQPEQRYKIEGFLQVGKSISEIALLVGVHKSTISRELSRNIPKRGKGSLTYRAINAQRKTMLRHHIKLKHHCFTEQMNVVVGKIRTEKLNFLNFTNHEKIKTKIYYSL